MRRDLDTTQNSPLGGASQLRRGDFCARPDSSATHKPRPHGAVCQRRTTVRKYVPSSTGRAPHRVGHGCGRVNTNGKVSGSTPEGRVRASTATVTAGMPFPLSRQGALWQGHRFGSASAAVTHESAFGPATKLSHGLQGIRKLCKRVLAKPLTSLLAWGVFPFDRRAALPSGHQPCAGIGCLAWGFYN